MGADGDSDGWTAAAGCAGRLASGRRRGAAGDGGDGDRGAAAGDCLPGVELACHRRERHFWEAHCFGGWLLAIAHRNPHTSHAQHFAHSIAIP